MHSDQPIITPEQDLFGRWPFAKQMAQTIIDWKDPASLVIALHGAWGEGKSSVLNLMSHALKDQSSILTFRFNPWRFTNEELLLSHFFHTLADTLNESVKDRLDKESIKDTFDKYGSSLSMIPEPHLKFLGTGLLIAGKFFGTKKPPNDLEALRFKIDTMLKKHQKRIVILIDDIDRLDHEEIYSIFRLVKLTADFPFTTYVLAFDPALVSEALSRKIPWGEGAKNSFIDKIVQVGLQLPPANPVSVKKIIFESIDEVLKKVNHEMTQSEIDTFVIHFEESFLASLYSPRVGKRYANAVYFGIPLVAGEVNLTDFLLIEAMRIFYPRLYKTIRSNSKVFIESKDNKRKNEIEINNRRKIIDDSLTEYSPKEREGAIEIIKFLFPQTSFLFNQSSWSTSVEETWARQLRICSKAYFDRFFQYGVPPGDISNKAVEKLIAIAEKEANVSKIQSEIKAIVGQQGWSVFIQKLREREKNLPKQSAHHLAIALARLGDFYPSERGLFASFLSTRSQASVLVAQIIKNLPDNIKFQTAKDVIGIGTNLLFAVECLRWFKHNEKETDNIFSSTESDQLGEILAKRIHDAELIKPLYESFSGDAGLLYYTWYTWGSKSELAKVLKNRFANETSHAQKFINIFIPTTWPVETGVPQRGELHREEYDGIAKYVDPNEILKALRSFHHDQLESEEFPYGRENDDGDKITAIQFAWTHRFVQQEKLRKDKQSTNGRKQES